MAICGCGEFGGVPLFRRTLTPGPFLSAKKAHAKTNTKGSIYQHENMMKLFMGLGIERIGCYGSSQLKDKYGKDERFGKNKKKL